MDVLKAVEEAYVPGSSDKETAWDLRFDWVT